MRVARGANARTALFTLGLVACSLGARARAGTTSKDVYEATSWMNSRQKVEYGLGQALRDYFDDPAQAALLKPVCAAARVQFDAIKLQLKSRQSDDFALTPYDFALRQMNLWRRTNVDVKKATVTSLETALALKLKECNSQSFADFVHFWAEVSFLDERLDEQINERPDPFLGVHGRVAWQRGLRLAGKPTPSPGSFRDELVAKLPSACIARTTTAFQSTVDHISRVFGLMTGCDIAFRAIEMLSFLDIASGKVKELWSPPAELKPADYGLAGWADLGVLADRRIYNLLVVAALVADGEHSLLEVALPLTGIPSLVDKSRRADYVIGDYTTLIPAGALAGDLETKAAKILETFTARPDNHRLHCTYQPQTGMVDRCVDLVKGEPMFSVRAELAFQYYSLHGYQQRNGLPLAGMPDTVPPPLCDLPRSRRAVPVPCHIKATMVPRGKYVFKGLKANKATGKKSYVSFIETAIMYAQGFMSIRPVEEELYLLDIMDPVTDALMFGAPDTLQVFAGLPEESYLFLVKTANLASLRAAHPDLRAAPRDQKAILTDVVSLTEAEIRTHTSVRFSERASDLPLIKVACATITELGFDGYYGGLMELANPSKPGNVFNEEIYICNSSIGKLGKETILPWDYLSPEPKDPANPVFVTAKANEVSFPPSEEYIPVGVSSIVQLFGPPQMLKKPYAAPLRKSIVANHFQ